MNRADWCDFHHGPSGTAHVVRRIERTGSSPAVYYACAPCREQRRLPALDERPEAPRERAG